MYNLLSSDVRKTIFECEPGFAEQMCMNVRDKTNRRRIVQQVVDGSALYTNPLDPKKKDQCIAFNLARGYFDCKFWIEDGFEYDLQDVAKMAETGERLNTSQSKQDVGWSVSKALLPDTNSRFTKSYSEVAYTLWVRMMKKLSQVRAASTAWIKPKPLPFFSHSRIAWLDSFQDFDMQDRLNFDETVKSSTQNCKVRCFVFSGARVRELTCIHCQ